MTTYTAAQVNAWYDAIDNQPTGTALDAADLAVYVASLNSSTMTPTQVQTAIEESPYTLNTVDVVIREYQAAFGRVPEQAGLQYWVGVVTANPSALASLNTTFANSAEFLARYGATATTIADPALVTALYTNVLGRAPNAAGLAYWAGSGLTAAQLLQAFATSTEFVKDAAAAIITYQNGEVAGTPQLTGPLPIVPAVTTFTLTTGIDAPGTGAFATTAITGNNNLIYGTFNGTGATYTPGDAIIAPAGSTGNTLNLSDLRTGGRGDLTPIATTVTNVSNLVVSSGEAVEINTMTAFAGFSGLTQLTVTSTSSGDADAIAAAATTNVTVNDTGAGGVEVDGGKNIVVTESGSSSVTVGDGSVAATTAIAPVGTVTVTMTGTGAGGVTVDGGTTIAITTSQTGGVHVGNGVTGTVTVTDTATGGGIHVDGGVGTGSTAGTAAVFVQAAGDYVHVGEYDFGSGTILAPTGDVVVNDIAATAYDGIVQATDYWVTDRGGANVTVDTNAGGVDIGYDSATPVAGADPTGNVVVTDTATGVAFGDAVQVYGGANVNISAVAGSIVVGEGSAASDPTGNVTIVESGVNTGYHYYNVIDVSGGVNVSITTTGAGDGITVGGDAPVTGTVNITDSYSGQYHDDITVFGGTTVTITESATEYSDKSYNTVGLGSGDAATVSTAADLAADATGNVTINNSSTFGSDTVYGGGRFAIYTNGSQQVSVTGGYDAVDYIVDAQSEIPGGVSKLASISLTGVDFSEVVVTANALTTLSVTNSEAEIAVENTVASNGLTLNLTNSSVLLADDSGSTGIGGTVTINSAAGAEGELALYLPNATGLVFDNANALDVFLGGPFGDIAKVTTITASGAGALNLGDVAMNTGATAPNTTLTSINASANTGGVEVTLNGDSASFTGGSGANVVTVEDTTGLSHVINGGTGASNEIVLTNIAGLYTGFLGGEIYNNADIQNFQILGLTGSVDGQPGTSGTYDVAGFSSVIVTGDSAALSLIDAGAAETLTLDGTITSPITWSDLAATGTLNVTVNDAVATLNTVGITAVTIDNVAGSSSVLTLSGGDPLTAITVTGASDTSLTLTDTTDTEVVTLVDSSSGSLTVDGLTSLTTITVSGAGDFSANGTYASLTTITDSGSGTFTLNGAAAAALTAVTDTGSGALTLVGDGLAALTTVNAAGSSGAVDVDGSASMTGVDFTGGSGYLTAIGSTVSASVVDSYTTGSGGGDITLGAGGAGTAVAGELVNLSASASVRDTIDAPTLTGAAAGDGVRAIITGFDNFVSGNRSAGDVIETGLAPTVVANASVAVSAPDETGVSPYATYTVSNGVFTLASSGTNPGFNELTDVQSLINTDGAGSLGMVQVGTTTYVIEAGATASLASDTILQLNNVTGITGFALASWEGVATSASSSISIGDAGFIFGAEAGTGGLGNGGTSAGATYNDAGYAIDTLTVNGSAATTVNTYNNLANFAELQVGATQGEAVVNQINGAGAELIVTTTAETTLNSLTYDGVVVLSADAGNLTIDSLIQTNNTEKTIWIASETSDAVTVGAISDTALTTINASHSDGAVTLGGDGLTGQPAAISTAGLTIDGGSGLLTAFVSGAGDQIYGGIGGINVTASGAGDQIYADGGGTNTIVASGASDTFNVVGTTTLTANGAGDTIYASGTVEGLSASGAVDQIVLSDASGYFNASGGGDTITLTDGGAVTLAGTGLTSSTMTATSSLGAGDTINVSDGASGSLWVGENATINLSGNGSTHIYLSGDVTGANSSSYIQTTINGAAGNESNLTLSFDYNPSLTSQVITTEHWAGGSSENSQVNVATATSLAGALNLAASQAAVEAHQYGQTGVSVSSGSAAALQISAHTGLVDWFQYGGNTYAVEANNTSATAAAHTALGANDIVVELTGIVNVNHIHLAVA